jgi:hypothetical protein
MLFGNMGSAPEKTDATRLKSVSLYLKWTAQISCPEQQFIKVGPEGILPRKKSGETQI